MRSCVWPGEAGGEAEAGEELGETGRRTHQRANHMTRRHKRGSETKATGNKERNKEITQVRFPHDISVSSDWWGRGGPVLKALSAPSGGL